MALQWPLLQSEIVQGIRDGLCSAMYELGVIASIDLHGYSQSSIVSVLVHVEGIME